MTFYPADDDGKGEDKSAPGNWGLLDLGGGGNGTPELREWILYGYDSPIVLGPEGYVGIYGGTGFRAALQSDIQERIGDQLIMIIYDDVTGTGANTQYRCIGFLFATIISCELNGNNAHATCRIDGVSTVHDLVIGGDFESPNIRKVQIVR